MPVDKNNHDIGGSPTRVDGLETVCRRLLLNNDSNTTCNSLPPGLVDPPLQSSMSIHEFSSASTCLNGTIPAGDVYEDFCHSAESARSQTSFREQQVEVCQDFDPSRLPSSTSLKDSCLNGTIPARNTNHCQG